MKRKKINIPVFLGCLMVVCLLIFVSFLGVAANDEGHATTATLLLERLFLILRFPTIALMLLFLREGWAVPYLFFVGLFVNAVLYAFLIERLYTWVSIKRRIQTK
jgi:phosphatidylglycerophosphate synthase